MPSLIVPIANVVTVVAVGTALSEGLKSPKAVAMFYAGVAKSCYTSTGSKRVACIVSAGACGFTITPEPSTSPIYRNLCS